MEKQKIKWDHQLLDKLSKASNRSKQSLIKEIRDLAKELNIELT
jgi:DNA polymerase I-like protein with 3'-5' exonuclease and polymerase domains